jgi:hypothetical protein
MPVLTRWFIKAGMLYFAFALFLGVILVASDAFEMPTWIAGLSPVYFHLFMVGWVTQLIFGVAYWMFPKFSTDKPRGSESLAWATFWLINAGLLIRMVAEPITSQGAYPVWGWALVLSALLQWLGGLAFCVNTWQRVK